MIFRNNVTNGGLKWKIFFKLKENGTTVRTEVLAGLTTFMTMAYIIALNPNLLTNFDVGSPLWNGVFLATCLACIFIAPIAAIIPPAATSAALIYVGVLMLQGLGKLDFNNVDEILPVFIMLLAMPVSSSIGHGIGIAMILYTCIKVFSGKAKEVSVLTYVISLLFLIKFFVIV